MFLRCFLTFAKSQPNVSYKNVSYKKRVLDKQINSNKKLVTFDFDVRESISYFLRYQTFVYQQDHHHYPSH